MIFCKKGFIDSKLMFGLIDCHSHILPGVDDGAKTQNEACDILSYFESLGVKRVILTPHIMEDYPLNNVIHLQEKFALLCRAYSGNIELSLGAEYMLDNQFDGLLDSNELITIFDNHLLVETPYISAPLNFIDTLKQIRSKGYQVILAHPERYMYMDDSYYDQLKEIDVRFQLNLLSLTGVYGAQADEKSKRLLKRDYYDFIGSDIHNLRRFQKEIERTKLSKVIIKKIDALKTLISNNLTQ